MNQTRSVLTGILLITAIATPLILAAYSPLLAWREPVYIIAGFAGVIALSLMLIQPLLITGYLMGIPAGYGRRVHRWVGSALVFSVAAHVSGLWITSPPDVVDALLLRSPTPFSIWGVVAMWGLVAVAALVMTRRRLGLKPSAWLSIHRLLVGVIVIGSVIHALLIQGTMEVISKSLICLLVVAVTSFVLARLQLRRPFR